MALRPEDVSDVDVGFFDRHDLSPARDSAVEAALRGRDPSIAWEAKNQAAVHRWYPARFGVEVAAFESAWEAVATFPEYAVCVAVTLADGDAPMRVCAPHGLDDLLDGIWRRNPARAAADVCARRLAHKAPARRWPAVRVVA
jgi:hypothetical protein